MARRRQTVESGVIHPRSPEKWSHIVRGLLAGHSNEEIIRNAPNGVFFGKSEISRIRGEIALAPGKRGLPIERQKELLARELLSQPYSFGIIQKIGGLLGHKLPPSFLTQFNNRHKIRAGGKRNNPYVAANLSSTVVSLKPGAKLTGDVLKDLKQVVVKVSLKKIPDAGKISQDLEAVLWRVFPRGVFTFNGNVRIVLPGGYRKLLLSVPPKETARLLGLTKADVLKLRSRVEKRHLKPEEIWRIVRQREQRQDLKSRNPPNEKNN